MPKFIQEHGTAILFCIIFLAVGLLSGLMIGNAPFLILRKEVGISDLANLILTIIVAVLIPLSLSPILADKRISKDLLIKEIEGCILFLGKIKETIDNNALENKISKTDSQKINSMIGPDLSIKLESAREQLNIAFGEKSGKLRDGINQSYIEYWREITGGDLMSDNFKFDLKFRNHHDRNYAKLESKLKKAVHEINKY
jgi:hypothetical protein